MHKMQQNNIFSLYDDWDETINYIMYECIKLAQNNIRLDTTG